MKVIERPTSTTHEIGFPFHLIKDEAEAENVKKIIGDREILHVMRSIDPNTFQPMLYFAIPEEGKQFAEWMKYVVHMALMVKE